MQLVLADGSVFTAHFQHGKDKHEHWETKCVFHAGKCQIKDCAKLVEATPGHKFYSSSHGWHYADTSRGAGLSRCNPELDTFRKPKGRIQSLTRALASYPSPWPDASRRFRTEVWAAYFKLSPLPTRQARDSERITAALKIARECGSIDGAHHKQWVIDQMCRALLGAGYEQFVQAAKAGVNGPDTYEWETGIAP